MDDDGALWSRSRLGDADALGVLFERHARAIRTYCFRRTGDVAAADDLTSATFLEAWRRRDVALDADSVLPWLYGVATNVVRNHRRSLNRFRVAIARMPRERDQPDFAPDAHERVACEQQMRDVLDIVRRLPRAEQEVLALCAWQGLDATDAAAALGLAPASVRARLSRARRRVATLSGDDHNVRPTVAPQERSPR